MQLTPSLVFLVLVFLVPVVQVLVLSVRDDQGWTLQYYREVLGTSVYLRTLLNTVEIAFVTTVVTLVLAFPLAYCMAFKARWLSRLIAVAVLLPFLTSLLVRTYAWMIILAPGGIVPKALAGLGLGAPALLYNRVGVLVGMVYVLLPYMVLTLNSVMRSIDPGLLRAASALGANGWKVFRRVFLPLTMPGVTAGSLLVFVLSVGYFVTPRLMGGQHDVVIGMSIDTQVEQALDWHRASALSVVLLVVTLIGLVLYTRIAGLGRIMESDA